MRRSTATALAAALLVCLLLPLLAACGAPADDGRISIVCTLFPQYDWLRSIIGDSERIELSLIIQNGTDPHSYQPTAADVLKISNCDMIVYIGGDSDVWVQEALERAKNTDTVKVAMTEVSGVTLREISSHDHEHGDGDHGHAHSHGALDEHLWLSLRNSATIVAELTERICELDPTGADLYRQSSADYILKLAALDAELESTVSEHGFMLFADRFPFVYLLADYGIGYAAAFEGCTTDVNADFDTVIRLRSELIEHDARYLAITETSDGALARTVVGDLDVEIIAMDSLQSVTRKQLRDGISYLSVMEKNIDLIKLALGAE